MRFTGLFSSDYSISPTPNPENPEILKTPVQTNPKILILKILVHTFGCVKFLSQMFNLPRKLHFFYCRAESMQRGRLARCGVSVSQHASCLNQDSQDYEIHRIILIRHFPQVYTLLYCYQKHLNQDSQDYEIHRIILIRLFYIPKS